MCFVPQFCPFKGKEKHSTVVNTCSPASAETRRNRVVCLLQLRIRQLKKTVHQKAAGAALGIRQHLPGGTCGWQCQQLRAALPCHVLQCRPAFTVILCSVTRVVIVIYWPRILVVTSGFQRLALHFQKVTNTLLKNNNKRWTPSLICLVVSFHGFLSWASFNLRCLNSLHFENLSLQMSF